MIDQLVGFCLRRRVAVIILAVLLVGFGVYAWETLSVEAYPELGDVAAQVTTQMPGLAAEEVEQLITVPLERQINGTPGLLLMRSTSTFGLSLITVLFRDGYEDYWARQRLLERINQTVLPQGAAPSLDPVAGPGGEIFRYTLESDTHNLQELSEIQRWVVIPALNRGHIKKIPYDFCLAGLIFSLPLITIGAANAFGWMLAYLRGASYIADMITSIAGNDPHLIMLLMVLLFTVVGDFIEPVPTIIIFMPLVNALTEAGDINAVHMGVVLIATLAFGLITPPYGLVLLMASKFVGISFAKALRAALPIYVVFLATIAFAIYFPSVVLWLPQKVLPESVGCFKSLAGTGYICPK